MAKTFLLQKVENGMHVLLLDPKTVSALKTGTGNRVICHLSDSIRFHCAILNRKEGGHYVYIKAALCKQLGLKPGARVPARFMADETTYQFPMPEELKEVLDTDPEANRIFHALTDGNQRGLIVLVTQVKSVDKRIERALKIAERLKAGIHSPRIILK